MVPLLGGPYFTVTNKALTFPNLLCNHRCRASSPVTAPLCLGSGGLLFKVAGWAVEMLF